MLRDHDLGAARVEVGDDDVAVKSLVRNQAAKGETVDQRRHADRVEALAGQQHEAHKIAERIGQRQDFGRHAAFGAADGLAFRPPFAPWPWRWTLTMVASTMAYSMSGSSEQAANSRRSGAASDCSNQTALNFLHFTRFLLTLFRRRTGSRSARKRSRTVARRSPVTRRVRAPAGPFSLQHSIRSLQSHGLPEANPAMTVGGAQQRNTGDGLILPPRRRLCSRRRPGSFRR